MNYKIFLIALTLYIVASESFAATQTDTLLFETVKNSSIPMDDFKYVRKDGWNKLYKVSEHPAIDSLTTDEVTVKILAEINKRKKEVGDTLRTADLFYIWKPYFEWINYIDPHYFVSATVPSPYSDGGRQKEGIEIVEKELRENATILPAHALCINDTLVVTVSNDDLLRTGDMILSINGISTEDLLKYNLRDRYTNLYILLQNYYFQGFAKEYEVDLIRDGQRMTISLEGRNRIWEQSGLLDQMESLSNSKYYENANAGYIKIPLFFPNNNRLIKHLRRDINRFKRQGCKNIIIDLRYNPGGNGHNFDKLLSIFIDKPEAFNSKKEKLKISKQTMNDYDFITDDMMGELIDLPDEYFFKTVPLDTKRYIGGVSYYVLMDEGTGSMAASFCNLLQFNGGAVLVGEPLLHNASKYGDVIDGGAFYRKCDPMFLGWIVAPSISISEADEYTKAVNGILMPDIPIPYVAKEYMKGEDDMLNKLLEVIKLKKCTE